MPDKTRTHPSDTVRGRTRFHIGFGKAFLLDMICQRGTRGILDGWTGTEEEVLCAIEADQREVFTSCDHVDETGRCLGHPPKKRTP